MFISDNILDKILCCRGNKELHQQQQQQQQQPPPEIVEENNNNNVSMNSLRKSKQKSAMKKKIREQEQQYLSNNNNISEEPRVTIEEIKERLKGGTTAVVALLRGKRLAVAWLGDSLAVLVKRRKPVLVVDPHKPDNEKERERITRMGGAVINLDGSWRVLGQLAVSRAIGDVPYKPYVSNDCDIRSIDILGDEDFLILATDGLWDTLSYADAVTFVYAYIGINKGDCEGVGRCLVEQARRNGSSDNITAVVVFLRPVEILMEEEALRRLSGEIPDECGVDMRHICAKDAAPASIHEIFQQAGSFNPDSPSNNMDLQNNPFSPATNGHHSPNKDSNTPDLSAGLPVCATPDPTIEDVESALAELDSLPEGDVDLHEKDDKDWNYTMNSQEVATMAEPLDTGKASPDHSYVLKVSSDATNFTETSSISKSEEHFSSQEVVAVSKVHQVEQNSFSGYRTTETKEEFVHVEKEDIVSQMSNMHIDIVQNSTNETHEQVVKETMSATTPDSPCFAPQSMADQFAQASNQDHMMFEAIKTPSPTSEVHQSMSPIPDFHQSVSPIPNDHSVSPIPDIHQSVSPIPNHNSVSPIPDVCHSASPIPAARKSASPVEDVIFIPVMNSPSPMHPVSPIPDVHQSFSPIPDVHQSVSPIPDSRKSPSPVNDGMKSPSPVPDVIRFKSPTPNDFMAKSPVHKSASPVLDINRAMSPNNDIPNSFSPIPDVRKSPSPVADVHKSKSPSPRSSKSNSPVPQYQNSGICISPVPGSPKYGTSPPASPRSVEGFVTSIELNNDQQVDVGETVHPEQSSGPFSVYVSSSPEPTSLEGEHAEMKEQENRVSPTPRMENISSPVPMEVNSEQVQVPTSSVEIVHAQSMVEVDNSHVDEVTLSNSHPIDEVIQPRVVMDDLMNTSMVLDEPITGSAQEVEQMMQFVPSNTEVVYNNLELQTPQVVHINSDLESGISPSSDVNPQMIENQLTPEDEELAKLMDKANDEYRSQTPEQNGYIPGETPMTDLSTSGCPITPIKEKPTMNERDLSPINTPKQDIINLDLDDEEVVSSIVDTSGAKKPVKPTARSTTKQPTPIPRSTTARQTPGAAVRTTTASKPTSARTTPASKAATPTPRSATATPKSTTPRTATPTRTATAKSTVGVAKSTVASKTTSAASKSVASTKSTITASRSTARTTTTAAARTTARLTTTATSRTSSTSATRTTATKSSTLGRSTAATTTVTKSSTALKSSTLGATSRPTSVARTASTTASRTTTSRPASAATTPTNTRRAPLSRRPVTSTETTTKSSTTAAKSSTLPAKSRTTAPVSAAAPRVPITRKPLYPGPKATTAADKEVKNTANKLLSQSRTVTRTTTTARTATAAAPTHKRPITTTTKKAPATTTKTKVTATKGAPETAPIIDAPKQDPQTPESDEQKIAMEEISAKEEGTAEVLSNGVHEEV